MIFWRFSWFFEDFHGFWWSGDPGSLDLVSFLEAPGHPFWRVLSRWPRVGSSFFEISFRSGGHLEILVKNLPKYHQNTSFFLLFERFWEVLSLSEANPLDLGVRISGFRQSWFQGIIQISPKYLFLGLRILGFDGFWRSGGPDPWISSKYLVFGELFERFWAVLSSLGLLGWPGLLYPGDLCLVWRPSGAFWELLRGPDPRKS